MALARVLCEALIGRESEVSLLATLRGDGGVVIVGGEAGMGKTRLVADLVTERRLEPERLELELKGFAKPVVAYRVRSGVPIN